jgi:hypothetical protein
MAFNLRDTAVRDTEAALSGVANALSSGRSELLLTPLARVGDALRLGLEVPVAVRRWFDAVPRDDLRAALLALVEETADWNLPTESVGDDADPLFTSVLRRRDEAESIRAAVRRILLPKNDAPEDIDEFNALSTVLLTIDETLRRLATRSRIVELLGTRAAMQPTWADDFADDAAGSETPPGELSVPGEVLKSFVPRDEEVARYVARGALSRYIQGAAAANPDFAEEVAACIDALIAAREDVSFVARLWRKQCRVSLETDPLSLRAVPARRYAAASREGTETVTNVVHLGALSPLDAEARVEVTSTEASFEIFPGVAPLARVDVDGKVRTEPDADGAWRVVVAIRPEPVRLHVVAADGRSFSGELAFAAAEPADETE